MPATAAGFGLNSGNLKMSIEAVLAGAIIGKAGANVKQISRLTGDTHLYLMFPFGIEIKMSVEVNKFINCVNFLLNAGFFVSSDTNSYVITLQLLKLMVLSGALLSGCKLTIRDHESNASMRNVEMEGTYEQIERASEMVRQFLSHKEVVPQRVAAIASHNFKTKLCENFSQGTCTFADRCHFAHGTSELRPLTRS